VFEISEITVPVDVFGGLTRTTFLIISQIPGCFWTYKLIDMSPGNKFGRD